MNVIQCDLPILPAGLIRSCGRIKQRVGCVFAHGTRRSEKSCAACLLRCFASFRCRISVHFGKTPESGRQQLYFQGRIVKPTFRFQFCFLRCRFAHPITSCSDKSITQAFHHIFPIFITFGITIGNDLRNTIWGSVAAYIPACHS